MPLFWIFDTKTIWNPNLVVPCKRVKIGAIQLEYSLLFYSVPPVDYAHWLLGGGRRYPFGWMVRTRKSRQTKSKLEKSVVETQGVTESWFLTKTGGVGFLEVAETIKIKDKAGTLKTVFLVCVPIVFVRSLMLKLELGRTTRKNYKKKINYSEVLTQTVLEFPLRVQSPLKGLCVCACARACMRAEECD